jgi:hypothetical protein
MKSYFLFSIVILLFGLASSINVFAQNRPQPVAAARLIDLMIESDPMVLKSNDEQRAEAFLREKNSRMIDYLTQRYPQYGTPDIDLNDPAASWFGVICAMYEAVGFQPLNGLDLKTKHMAFQQIPTWLQCTLNTIGAAYGVTQLVSSLGAFSYGTVWKVVKFVVKKYITGWLGTAIALVNIANNCF